MCLAKYSRDAKKCSQKTGIVVLSQDLVLSYEVYRLALRNVEANKIAK